MDGAQSYIDRAVRAMDAEMSALDAGDMNLTRSLSDDVVTYAKLAAQDANTPLAFMAMIQRKHELVMNAIRRTIDDANQG